MMRLVIASIVLLGLTSGIQVQGEPENPQPPSMLNNLMGGLSSTLGGNQQQPNGGPLSGLLNSAGNQNGADLLGGLLRGGGNGSGMNALNQLPNFGQGMSSMGMGQNGMGMGMDQNGLAQMLFEIPRRAIETMNQLMSNARNMMQGNSARMNGFGRNGSNLMRNMMQQAQGNDQNPLNQVNGLTKPLTDSLQQGRLPNVQQLTQGLQSTVSDIGKGLSRSLSMPTRGSATVNA